jgi:hypothetical protein
MDSNNGTHTWNELPPDDVDNQCHDQSSSTLTLIKTPEETSSSVSTSMLSVIFA